MHLWYGSGVELPALPAVLQKCGYLCNMAVSKQWRRRGIAGALLTAIEDICLLAGEEASL
jgi:GNAT superfamily N-acetyltransferase